jgi:hypothetical protein
MPNAAPHIVGKRRVDAFAKMRPRQTQCWCGFATLDCAREMFAPRGGKASQIFFENRRAPVNAALPRSFKL